MTWRRLVCWPAVAWAAQAAGIDPGKDPVPSVMWDFYHKQLLGDAPFVFDERVKLLAPPFAEDARQVPLEIDARAFKGDVVRILAWAELNPCRKSSTSARERCVAVVVGAYSHRTGHPVARRGADTRRPVARRFDPDRCSRRRLYRAQRGAHPARLGGAHRRGAGRTLPARRQQPLAPAGGPPDGQRHGQRHSRVLHQPCRTAWRDGRPGRLELFPAVSENPNLAFDIEGAGADPPGVARQQRQ
jgi:sulfur-oxidizing protein SoxY